MSAPEDVPERKRGDRQGFFGWLSHLADTAGLIQLVIYAIVAVTFGGTAIAATVRHVAGSFPVLAKYVTAFLSGIATTISVSALAIVLGTIIGIAIAAYMHQRSRSVLGLILRAATHTYLYAFLAIPAYALILFLYYSSALSSVQAEAVSVIALGLNLSPFAAKIFISGFRNIQEIQLVAATASGYTDWQVTRMFRIPMILRAIGQPLLVQYFTTIKLSSLTAVIGVAEIMHTSQTIIRETMLTEQVYVITILCYLAIVGPVAILADVVERKSRD